MIAVSYILQQVSEKGAGPADTVAVGQTGCWWWSASTSSSLLKFNALSLKSPGVQVTKRDQRALPGNLSIHLFTIIHASRSDSAITVPIATATVCFGEGSHFQDQQISLMSGGVSSLETSLSTIKLVDPNHQTQTAIFSLRQPPSRPFLIFRAH